MVKNEMIETTLTGSSGVYPIRLKRIAGESGAMYTVQDDHEKTIGQMKRDPAGYWRLSTNEQAPVWLAAFENELSQQIVLNGDV